MCISHLQASWEVFAFEHRALLNNQSCSQQQKYLEKDSIGCSEASAKRQQRGEEDDKKEESYPSMTI